MKARCTQSNALRTAHATAKRQLSDSWGFEPMACRHGERSNRAPQNRWLVQIGLVGFEPTACRHGDRSKVGCRAHVYLFRFCSIARVGLLHLEWQNFHCELRPTALHVSLPSTRQHCGGEYGQPNPRKNPRNDARFSDCAIRNNRTFHDQWFTRAGENWTHELSPRRPL
jgi:hypothetical protein